MSFVERYYEQKAQLAALSKQAEATRVAEFETVVADIRAKVS
jgi:hypothetical protein